MRKDGAQSIVVFLLMLMVSASLGSAHACPMLQLDIDKGHYDPLTQTIVSSGSTFTLPSLFVSSCIFNLFMQRLQVKFFYNMIEVKNFESGLTFPASFSGRRQYILMVFVEINPDFFPIPGLIFPVAKMSANQFPCQFVASPMFPINQYIVAGFHCFHLPIPTGELLKLF